MKPTFFKTPAAFRRWFEKHHESSQELLVGFYKVDSGKPSITWPEAVDEALCFGWIDGVRRSLGEEAYVIRFTPRKAKSYWSSVNLRKAEAQIAAGRMHPKGLAAFQARDASGKRKYSFENAPVEMPESCAALLKKHPKAAAFHSGTSPSYRKTVAFWLSSAKTEETRMRRMRELIESAERGLKVRQFTPPGQRTSKGALGKGAGRGVKRRA